MEAAAEVVETLVEKARRRLRERTEALQRALRLVDNAWRLLESEGLLHRVRGMRKDVEVAGLDGSRQVLRIGLGRYLVIAVTAVVHLPKGLLSREARAVYPLAEAYEAYDPSGLGIEAAAEAAMLLLETLALSETRSSIIMLDGPVVDPPAPVDPGIWGLLRADVLMELGSRLDYHQLRAEKLAELVSENTRVIGVVKRISGFSLLSTRLGEALHPLKGLSDDDILTLLSTRVGRGGLVIGPFTPALPEKVSSRYRAMGLRIITYYTFSPSTSKPMRIETILPSDGDEVDSALETASIVAGLTLPGHHYPLPVQLAHEKSHLPRQLAKLIYREALTSLATREDTLAILPRMMEEA